MVGWSGWALSPASEELVKAEGKKRWKKWELRVSKVWAAPRYSAASLPGWVRAVSSGMQGFPCCQHWHSQARMAQPAGNLPSITRYIPRVNLSSLWVAQTDWVVASGVLSVAFPRSEWAPPEDSPCLISLSLWCWRISCVILGLLPSLRTPVGPWEGRTGINVSCLLITSSLGEGKAGKLSLTSNLCKKLGLWKKKKRVENNNICALDGNTFSWSDFWLWKGEQRKMWLPV